MHRLIPLTPQERAVRDLLTELMVTHYIHQTFKLGERSAVVDFYLPSTNLVIECWSSQSRRGVALAWVERNAAYVDLKFSRLKTCYPGLRCLGFLDVPQVDLLSLERTLGRVMLHSDFMAYAPAALQEILEGLR
jgi:hypothetical protein